MEFFLLSTTFQTHLFKIFKTGCRTRSPTDLQHLCFKALINKSFIVIERHTYSGIMLHKAALYVMQKNKNLQNQVQCNDVILKLCHCKCIKVQTDRTVVSLHAHAVAIQADNYCDILRISSYSSYRNGKSCV